MGAEPSLDYERNRAHYDEFWSRRWRRTWNYSSQTKVKRFRALLRRHGQDRRQGLQVFDQGFGLGLMLFCFDRSARLAGLEMGEPAVRGACEAARQLGFPETDLRVFVPGTELPAEWRERFDVVLSSHVLEHLADPKPVLEQLVGLIRPGGHACLVVPINEPPGEDMNHFSLFSAESIRQLAESCGLEVLESTTCDRLWDLIAPAALSAQRKKTLPLAIVLLLFNSVFGFAPHCVLRWADTVLGWLGYTERQCFLWCRKPAGA